MARGRATTIPVIWAVGDGGRGGGGAAEMVVAAVEKQRRSRNQVLGEEEQGAHTYIGWGPFVPGGGSIRDKRYFWVGRENSQPAAHL